MFCGNCGKEVRNEEVFCKNCGKRIAVHFNEETKNEVKYNGGSMDKQTKLVIWFTAAIFGIALLCGIVVAHGKSLTNGKILKDEDIVNWIEGGIGGGYDIELTKVYDRETSENKILVYCEFVAQNESVKRVGKICVEYRMQNGKWKVSYCSPIDYDNWERYPVKGVDYETVINDVKEENNSHVSRIEILEQNTDLAAKTDCFKVQEIRTINQLSIVTTYEKIYYFGGRWESAVGSGRIIERKIDIDITGEWVGHQNGEYYYVNILECGEAGSISAEFVFPYERYMYSNVSIQGVATGEIDLSRTNPAYALESEKVVSEDTEITSCWFWISFDEADSEDQIRMTTSQGNTCVLERKRADEVTENNRQEIHNLAWGMYEIYEYDLSEELIRVTTYYASGAIAGIAEVDGKRVGSTFYYESGAIKGIAERDESGNYVSRISYYESGAIAAIREYDENGKPTKWTVYYESGEIYRIEEFDAKGSSMGGITYYEDGNLESVWEEHEGKPEKSIGYYESGAIKYIKEWDANGVQITYYNEDGTIDRIED